MGNSWGNGKLGHLQKVSNRVLTRAYLWITQEGRGKGPSGMISVATTPAAHTHLGMESFETIEWKSLWEVAIHPIGII